MPHSKNHIYAWFCAHIYRSIDMLTVAILGDGKEVICIMYMVLSS